MLNLNLNLNRSTILGAGGPPAPACPPLIISTASIMGYYKFDDNYNKTIGEAFFGTPTANNMEPFGTGKFGSAASFNGTSSYLAFGNNNLMEPVGTGGWSLSCWVSLDNFTANQSIWDKRTPGSNGMRILIRPGVARDVLCTWNSQNAGFSMPAGKFTDSTYHHVCVRQMAGTNNFEVLIDDTSLGVITRTAYTASGQILNVGRDRQNNSSHIDGRIDEYSVWDRQLTNAEVTTLSEGTCPLTTDLDLDAYSFITATGITNETEITAVNQLVTDLKAESLWSKMVAVYPFVGSSADSQKYNLVDPRDLDAAYRITWGGTLTHDYNGVKGDGTSGYGQTRIITSSYVNSQGFFGYSSSLEGGVGSDSLWGYNGILSTLLNPRNTSDEIVTRLSSTVTLGTSANATDVGFFGHNRENGTDITTYHNGTSFNTTQASTAYPSNGIFLLNYGSNYSQRRLSSFYATDGLLDSEIATLETIDLAFQTTLGRQV